MSTQRGPSRTGKSRTLRRMAIVGGVVALLGVVGVGLHAANTVQKNRLLSDAMQQGREAYDAQDYAGAIEHLAYYQSRRADNPDVMRMLAGAHAGNPSATRTDLAAAAGLARQAWTIDATQIDAMRLELTLRRRLGQNTERLAVAQRILASAPDDAAAGRAEIESLAALGRRDEALDRATAMAAAEPESLEAHRIVLRLLSGLDPAEGRQRMLDYGTELVELWPDDPRFVALASQAVAQAGDLAAASEIAERLVELSGEIDGPDVAPSVQLLDALSLREAADRLIVRLSEREDLGEAVSIVKIQRMFKSGRVDEARALAEVALDGADVPSGDLVVWAAVSGIESAGELAAEAEPYHLSLLGGYESLSAGDPAAAVSLFREALSERESDSLALAGIAAAHEQLGAWAEAERARQRALRESPEFSAVRLAQVESLLSRGRPDRAAQASLAGLRIDPNNGALMLAYVMSIADLADRNAATTEQLRIASDVAESLDSAAEEGATPASPLLARLMIARGRLRTAEAVIERLLLEPPGSRSPRQLMSLAQASERAGLVQTGALSRLIDQDPRLDPAFLLDRAARLIRDGRREAALEMFESARSSVDAGTPRAASLHLAWVALLDRLGDQRAFGELRALTETQRDSAVAQTLVLESASAWSDEQVISAAVSNLRRVAGEQSSAWRVHESRRLLSFGRNEADAAKAVVLLEPLTLDGVSDPVAHLVMSDALRLLGDADAAIRQLEQAVDAGFDRPSVSLRLIELLRGTGDVESARRRARQLTALASPDDSFRRQRAGTLLSLGLVEDARPDADELMRSDEPGDVLLSAIIAARLGDREQLDARLDLLTERPGMSGPVLAGACRLLVDSGRPTDAFLTLETNRPSSADPEFLRAEAAVLFATQQPDSGLELLRDAYAISDDAGDAVALVRALSASAKPDEAQRVASAAAARFDSNEELTLLAKAIEIGQAGLAADTVRATPIDRTIAALRQHVIDSNDPESLMAELRRITTEFPTYYPAWAVLTSSLERSGRLDEAADAALTASRLLPDDTRPARQAVGVMVKLHPLNRALTAAREWQRRARPNTYEPDTTIAAILMRLDRYEEAADLLDTWAERIAGDASTPPVLVRLLAARLASSDRPQEAAELFDRREAKDARWLDHRIEVARELIRFADAPDAARSWLNGLPGDASADPDLALRLAQARVDLAARTARADDAQAAIDAADTAGAIATAATREPAMLLRVESLRVSQRFDEAIAEAGVLADRPDASPVPAAVIAHLIADRAVRAPGQADAASIDLAVRRSEESLAATERGPVSPAVRLLAIEAVGRTALLTGDTRQAEDRFRSMLVVDPNHIGAQLGMAEVMRDTDRAAQARRIVMDPRLRRALDRFPLLAPRLDRVLETVTAGYPDTD
ncbi:MAG: tetratricopeptide repeat protein [Planctomycetota bacterium]